MYNGKEVAVKVWLKPLEKDVEERYFIREVLAGCTVNDKNCLHYYGFSITPEEEDERGNKYPSKPIIIMEKGKGSLLKYFLAYEVDINDRLSIINQIADGLSYFHNQGYIHRDLKVLIMI